MKTKKTYPVILHIEAYSQADAQAKAELLLQLGAFCKNFNINHLADSFLKSVITSSVAKLSVELGEVNQKEARKEEQPKVFAPWLHPINLETNKKSISI